MYITVIVVYITVHWFFGSFLSRWKIIPFKSEQSTMIEL